MTQRVVSSPADPTGPLLAPDVVAEGHRSCVRACFSLAVHITGDDQMAVAVVQEAFAAPNQQPGNWDPARTSRAWLLARTHGQAVRALRQRRRRAGRRCAEQLLDTAAQVTRLQSLPAPQRECFVLAYFGGYTQPEIAMLTRSTVADVQDRTRSAMCQLLGQPAD